MIRRTIRITTGVAVVMTMAVTGTSRVSAQDDHDDDGTEMIVWLRDHDDDDDDDDDDDGDENAALDPAETIATIAARHDLVVLDTLVASKGIFLLRSPEELDEGKVKKLFKDDDEIRYAEPNYEGGSADGNRFHAWPAGPPSTSGVANDVDVGLDLEAVHAQATGDGVVIAILDTGVDRDHQALSTHVDAGWDFIDDDGDPDDEAQGLDRDADGLVDEAWGHGTHISGIVSAVAPDADLLSYRVLDADGSGRVFAVAAAIFDAVDRGADVINLSFSLDHKSRSTMLKDAMKYAKKAGVIVVAAAGNEAADEKRYPAAETDVISVSAIDADSDTLASFANHGDWVEVGAPGVAVMSTLPDGRRGTWSGSSMAAPFVAGQAAILIEHASKDDAKKVRDAIRKTSRKLETHDGRKVKHGAIDILASLDKVD